MPRGLKNARLVTMATTWSNYLIFFESSGLPKYFIFAKFHQNLRDSTFRDLGGFL